MVELNKNIGIIFNIEQGYLVEHKQVGIVQNEFLPCMDWVKEKISASDVDVKSVYVTGSVAKGTAVKQVSDLDLTFIFEDINFNKLALFKLWDELIRGVPLYGFTHIDCKYLSMEEIMSSKAHMFIFKYEGICIYGESFAQGFGPVSISSCYMYGNIIFDQIQHLKENKDVKLSDDVLRKYCRSIMKLILRTGMESVMEKENKYTDDLYPCYLLFSKYYPEEEPIMREIMQLVLNPSSDKKVIFEKISWAERFFEDKISRVVI